MLLCSEQALWLGGKHALHIVKKKASPRGDASSIVCVSILDELEAVLKAQTEVDEVTSYSGKNIDTGTVIQ